MRRSIFFVLTLGVFLAMSFPLCAQVGTQGAIVGTVTDSTGAVIPGAEITVVQAETGFTRKAATDASGEFSAVALPIGTYTVTVSARGFKTWTLEKAVLTIGARLRIYPAPQVGGMRQQVTVTANAKVMQTENSSVNTVIDMKPMLSMPLPVCKFVGWARTILCVDVFYAPRDPYEMEIEAMDSILPGEVVAVSTGESKRNAPWGELLSTAARVRGARRAVVDGLVRDVKRIQQLGFPVFAAGIKPVDSKVRGLVIDYNVPVQCGGIVIQPGDLIFADYDGIVAIPAGIVEETLRLAWDKVSRENHSRSELLKGAYLSDVYAKYGVL